MKMDDDDKSGSDSPACFTGLPENVNKVKCNGPKRIRKITEKLYECLTVDNACRNRFSFAARNFCSWLLKNEPGRSEKNFPCCKDDQSDK